MSQRPLRCGFQKHLPQGAHQSKQVTWTRLGAGRACGAGHRKVEVSEPVPHGALGTLAGGQGLSCPRGPGHQSLWSPELLWTRDGKNDGGASGPGGPFSTCSELFFMLFNIPNTPDVCAFPSNNIHTL